MKVRAIDPSPPPASGRTAENAPPAPSERMRALWQRNWQARWTDRAEQAERTRGGTRLNDWPQQRPDSVREEPPPAAAPASDDGARHGLDTDRRAGRGARETLGRGHRHGRDEPSERQGEIGAPPGRTPNLPPHANQVAHVEAAQWPQQFDRLSQVMADLCGRRSKAPESWNVHVEMDPRLLPETMLHLSASQHLIQFRFACGAQQSQQLLSQNVDALRTRIASEIGESRPFDIEIE